MYYVGINNKAKKVGSCYIGVNGISRKIKYMYIGVDGVARLFYGTKVKSNSHGTSINGTNISTTDNNGNTTYNSSGNYNAGDFYNKSIRSISLLSGTKQTTTYTVYVNKYKYPSDRDTFLGYYPVLLDSNGNEVGKLNPDDYSKFEDGTSAPITSTDYDVMVFFPKRGIRIQTDDNDVTTVDITDEPDNSNFDYSAFSYGAYNNCDGFYIGAYQSWYDGIDRELNNDDINNTKLYSISGKNYRHYANSINHFINREDFRKMANNKGNGYEIQTLNIRNYLIAAYIYKFGNIDWVQTIGAGFQYIVNKLGTSPYCDGTSGETNTRGMNWGVPATKTYSGTNPYTRIENCYQIKCLGIEDLWGNKEEILDGVFIRNSDNEYMINPYNKDMDDYNKYVTTGVKSFYKTVYTGSAHFIGGVLGFLPKNATDISKSSNDWNFESNWNKLSFSELQYAMSQYYKYVFGDESYHSTCEIANYKSNNITDEESVDYGRYLTGGSVSINGRSQRTSGLYSFRFGSDIYYNDDIPPIARIVKFKVSE